MTLAEVVVQNSAAADIFDDLNIDYYCHGDRLLGEALRERNLSVEEFSGELAKIAQPQGMQSAEPDWQIAPLDELIEHIVLKHHTYLNRELPALEQLMAKMPLQNRANAASFQILQSTVQRLRRDLELQMRKEEAILFPAIANLEARVQLGGRSTPSQFGSVGNLAKVLGQEHQKTVRELDEIRQLTNASICPLDCDCAMQTLFQRLKSLASDMHRHVHLENNVLFPRAAALERGETQ
jgi:regulator of cell morphogenesis and NO signaling